MGFYVNKRNRMISVHWQNVSENGKPEAFVSFLQPDE